MICRTIPEPMHVNLRIPGPWTDTAALADQLPQGYALRCGEFIHPHGRSLEFHAFEADREFPTVFSTVLARSPRQEENLSVQNYRMNACLTADGGDLESAKRMMRASMALLRAGGAGVFIDNSGRSHGASDWLHLAQVADLSSLLWAFVSVVNGRGRIFTVGMQVLGKPDTMMHCEPHDEDARVQLERFLELCHAGPDQIANGRLIERLQIRPYLRPRQLFPPDSPMHNPFGEWHLVRETS